MDTNLEEDLELIDKVREILGNKTLEDFAIQLNVKIGSLNKWKKNGLPSNGTARPYLESIIKIDDLEKKLQKFTELDETIDNISLIIKELKKV